MGLRETKKRELKSELSRAGIRLFSKHGFAETTIDDIVDPLGVSKRTFFRYFATKEDVVFAWYEELTGELVAALEARPLAESPFDAVCATLASLLHYYDDDPEWARAMLRLTNETPSLLGKSYEKRAMWEHALAHALHARLPKRGAELRANVIVGAAMAAFTRGVEAWAGGDAASLRSCIDKAFAYAKQLG
ncbi:MAG TPA: TetR family transcriptional regulator [Kofleriaceae bacterium]|jgi:AcrR family transcriptional regulator